MVVLAAGCGGGGGGAKSNGEATKAAAQVVADAQKAAVSASSVHVSGSIVDAGKPLTLDLQIVKDKGGKGTMAESGLSFDIVRIGDTAYLHGSDAFWQKFGGAAAATLLRGKWLKGSATTGNLASLTQLTDISKLLKASLSGHGTLKNGGETTYQGQKAVAITDTTQGGTLYVSATGTPYPIALVGSKSEGTVSFDSWNKSVSISAPKDAIDISALGG